MQDVLVKRLVARTDHLGLPPKVLAPVAALVARDKQLQDGLITARSAGDSAFAAAVNELASSGEVSEGVTGGLAFYDLTVSRGRESTLNRAVEHARASVMRDAHTVGLSCGPAVFEALKQVADAAVTRVTAVKIPASVVDDRSAFAARVGTDRWEELRAAWQVWEDAHEAYRILRDLGWVPIGEAVVAGSKLSGSLGERWLRYGNPIRCPRPAAGVAGALGGQAVKLSPPLHLAHSAAAGARPGMYSPEEAKEPYARYLRAVQVTRDGPTRTNPSEDAAALDVIRRAVDGEQRGILARSRRGV